MKKTLLIILALILVLAFAVGCGNNNDSAASDANGTAVTADDDEETLRGSDVAKLENIAAGMEDATLDLDNGETQRTSGPDISLDDLKLLND